jgi:hypothetical protein
MKKVLERLAPFVSLHVGGLGEKQLQSFRNTLEKVHN